MKDLRGISHGSPTLVSRNSRTSPHVWKEINIAAEEKSKDSVNEKSFLQFPTMTAPADDTIIVPMTAEMVPKAARLHINALAGSRTASMGETYVRAFIDWFRRVEHGGIALVAIDSHSDVVGYVIGAPLGYTRPLSRHLA